MSGFEVVGVILAVYPLIVGALEAYKATKGGRGATSLIRHLNIEEIIFKEFIDHLVALNVLENGLLGYEIVAPPGLALCTNPTVQSDIRNRLGTAKADSLIAILKEIDALLSALHEELTSRDQSAVDLLHKFRSRMRQIKFNMPQSSLKERLDKLTALNIQLDRLLADRSLPRQPPLHRRLGTSKQYLLRDHSHAVNIYDALCDGYRCECTSPHRANFGLPRISNDVRTDSGLISARQFELLFAVEESRMEDIDPDVSNDPDGLAKSWSQMSIGGETFHSSRRFSVSECNDIHDRAQQRLVRDLCIFTKSPDPDECEPGGQALFLKLKEKQYSLQTSNMFHGVPQNVKYLDELLDDQHFLLSRKDRICLALSLSHTVLSFHATPWIETCWTWNDFCIDRENEGQLFVARKFYSIQTRNFVPESRQPLKSDFWAIRGEPILTRLGFALTELALGKRLKELRSHAQFQSMDLDTKDFLTAKALVDSGQIVRAESLPYEDVVRACLHHQFTSDSKVFGLDSSRSSFQEDAERSIISPLHKIVIDSWGTS